MANDSLDVIDATLSIGEVARRAGIQASTIRYYERMSLLEPPERQGGKRRYQPSVLSVLAAIGAAKEAGFSLREIKLLFDGFERDVPPSERWQRFAGDKLRELDALAERLEAMRRLLHEGLECGCLRLEHCELISQRQA